jgi:UPF0716 family protein affecting phage T7 exclusion
MSRRALSWLVLASLVAGLVLMIPFEATVTRALGVVCLLAFVAGGLFLLATPDLLAAEEEEERDERP